MIPLRATFKVLVCGGRDYADEATVWSALDEVYERTPVGLLAQGGAEGADRLAFAWAMTRGVPCATFEAAWATYGRSAGPRRNQWMLEIVAPDLVVAFPGGAGTEDTVRRARAAGVEVRRIS